MRALLRLGLGGLVLALAFVLSVKLEQTGAVGLINISAIVLCGLGPIGVALIGYELQEIAAFLATLWRALSGAEQAETRALSEELQGIAQALKGGRPEEAARIAEASRQQEARAAGLLLLKRYERSAMREALEEHAGSEIARIRRAEDFFLTMARAAPAFGLIGTILGFIDLLRKLNDASALGPGMALALTATLYGIGSSYCIYHPLAKAVAAYAKKRHAGWRSAEAAMLMVHDGRAVSDVASLFGRAA